LTSANARTNGVIRKIGIAAAGVVAATLMTTASASAAVTTVYDNTPSPLPGNVPSLGFEATSTSEFGGLVELAGTERDRPQVEVGFSSWGCESGTWHQGNCSSTPGARFTHRVKFSIYEVAASDEPGELLGRVAKTVEVPYRRSANYTHCTGPDAGKWYNPSDDTCYNGRLFTRRLVLGDIDLPDQVIISAAYNTTHYGSSPIGESAPCYTEDGGCGYDSLNVALTGPPSIGSNPRPDDAYVDSTWGGAYCDGGAGGTGTFRLDVATGPSCNWTGAQPMFRVRAR
jgi:hypothetical protein